jgi:hypothetical protein
LSEDVVRGLDDEGARQVLLQDREHAAAGPHFKNSILGPRLVPRRPAQITYDWVDIITMPAGQPLVGYLDITAIAEAKREHDFLVTLLVDYRQMPFELGSDLAPAHILRLPAWEPRTFQFRLPEPLPAGYHELLFLVHDDPHNIYAARGVIEKHRQGGKLTFNGASGRPFDLPIAARYFVMVGEKTESSWIQTNWMAESFEPRETDLLNTPLLLSLTGDETDALMQREPAIVAGARDPLYAFVCCSFVPPDEFGETTAALAAILDHQQVRINGQEALFFKVRSGQHYRIPLRIEWPEEIKDGKVHSLYVGIALSVDGTWWHLEGEGRWQSTLPYFPRAVMVAPERSLIEYPE